MSTYAVDGDDRVIELSDVPQSSPGAPVPLVLADDGCVAVCFALHEPDERWDGTTVRVVEQSTADPSAIVVFRDVWASIFGHPNDEAFSGHPLASRGLHPYGAFEVKSSSWWRELERRNSVHPYHRREHFEAYRHFVLSFHDSTFECVARTYEVSRHDNTIDRLLPRMYELLGQR